MDLIAEIYNKISQSGTNLSDRQEDKLTGDVFGTLRYLPFEDGLKPIFTTVEFKQKEIKDQWLTFIENEKGYDTEINFWHREEEGEIDVLLTNDHVVIGIEVKYLSGLSSEDADDEMALNDEESGNQLSRYSRMIVKCAKEREAFLLFLAPYNMMSTVRKAMINRSIINPSVELGFLCWEDIYDSLSKLPIDPLDPGRQLMIKDVQALLFKKGFTTFKGFHSTILNIPIEKIAYSFQKGEVIRLQDWHWPTKTIKEELFYEFNTTD